jgi:hypothetical protein
MRASNLDMRALLCLALLLPAAALAEDPLKSQACAQALGALEASRGSERAASLRTEAARACLGGGTPGARSQRWAQPPVAVPPPQIDVPARAQASPPVAMPPPPLEIPRPATITACDPSGCWTDQGTRLPRLGPQLTGPGGLCTAQGGFAYCP